MQVLQENQDLAARHGAGDPTALGELEQALVKLGAGRVGEHELRDTLMRTLGGGM